MQQQPTDERDRAILRELMRDGRLTNVELAERVNLSPSACLRRVRAMEEGGLIAGYVMLLDGRPTAQWSRLAVGRSDDLGTGATATAPHSSQNEP